jgi:hypothetical protein
MLFAWRRGNGENLGAAGVWRRSLLLARRREGGQPRVADVTELNLWTSRWRGVLAWRLRLFPKY